MSIIHWICRIEYITNQWILIISYNCFFQPNLVLCKKILQNIVQEICCRDKCKSPHTPRKHSHSPFTTHISNKDIAISRLVPMRFLKCLLIKTGSRCKILKIFTFSKLRSIPWFIPSMLLQFIIKTIVYTSVKWFTVALSICELCWKMDVIVRWFKFNTCLISTKHSVHVASKHRASEGTIVQRPLRFWG